jgi:hypothetical protein
MGLSPHLRRGGKAEGGKTELTKFKKLTGWRQGAPDARAGQISHPLSLQASLRAVGCLISSFATRMTLSIGFAAKMLKNPHSEIPNPQLKRGSHGGTKTQREKTG